MYRINESLSAAGGVLKRRRCARCGCEYEASAALCPLCGGTEDAPFSPSC